MNVHESPDGRIQQKESRHVTTYRCYRSKCQSSKMPVIRWRIVISALIGMITGWFCFWLQHRLNLGAGDFSWAIHLAQRFLARQNPYDTPLEQYPFTAGLFALPFVRLRPELAAG